MKLITCPNTPDFSGDVPDLVFMAGGITNAPMWQDYLFSLVEDRVPDDFSYLNPRRPDFDVRDPSMEQEQIEWEYSWISRSSTMTFWFCKEALCPITLFELGKELGQQMVPHPRKKIFIGMDPDYARRSDVEIQTALVDDSISISYTLEDLAAELIAECHSRMV